MKLYYSGWHMALRVVAPLLTRIEVRGIENIPPSGSLILVSNHLSIADPPILVAYVKRHIHFILKEELYESLVFRVLLPPGEPIPVRRGKPGRDALRQCEAILKTGGVIGIFPEGTRSHSGETQEARAGVVFLARRTGAPILPVAIAGTEHILPGRFPWFRRARVRLTFGRPFTLAELDADPRADREALAHQVMARVVALLPEKYHGRYGEPLPQPATATAEPVDS